MTFYLPSFSLIKSVARHPFAAILYTMNYFKEKYILMSLREQKISELTNFTVPKVRTYFNELERKIRFQKCIQDQLRNTGLLPIAGMTTPLRGPVLYVTCRLLKPNVVVETGVASGVSSLFILQALEDNERGNLFSIDQPDPNMLNKTGWLIPDELRCRWHLIMGRSSEKLDKLLNELRVIDVFLHDSEHSYNNMIWEYRTAWRFLRFGGVLFSDDITSNNAFFEFCKQVKRKPIGFNLLGGIRK